MANPTHPIDLPGGMPETKGDPVKTTGAARRHRWVAAFTTTLMVATATAALADNIVVTDKPDTLTVGTPLSVSYYLEAAQSDGCDAPVSVTLSAWRNTSGSTYVAAPASEFTISDVTLDFTACGTSAAIVVDIEAKIAGKFQVRIAAPSGHNVNPGEYTVQASASSGGTTDTTAPEYVCDPVVADSVWHAGNQSHDCTATDATGVAVTTDVAAGGRFTLVTSVADGAETNDASTNSVRLCDTVTPAANCKTAGPISGWKIDRKAPTISGVGPTTVANSAGWYKTDVVNQFSASDGGSGLAGGLSSPYAFSKTTSGEGAAVTVASGSVFDAVGNENTGVDSAAFKIDKTQPTVTLNGTAHGSEGTATTASTINLSATASDGLSGVAGVSVGSTALSASSGGYSGSVALSCGANLFTATATDVAGNTADSSSITVYRNCWTIEILRPLDPSSGSAKVLNTVKNGRVVPFKVKLSYDGSEMTSGITPRFAFGSTSCTASATDAVEEIVADAGQSSANTSAFRWSDDGFWIYNVDTSALGMATNSCYRLDVLVNGYRATASTYAILKPTR